MVPLYRQAITEAPRLCEHAYGITQILICHLHTISQANAQLRIKSQHDFNNRGKC
jgi:hypothetical protein